MEDGLQNTVTGWIRVDLRRVWLVSSSRCAAVAVVVAAVAVMSFKHDRRVEMTLADSHRHEKSHSSSSVGAATAGTADGVGMIVFCFVLIVSAGDTAVTMNRDQHTNTLTVHLLGQVQKVVLRCNSGP